MVHQLVSGGSSDLASVSEVIDLATSAVEEASAALVSASEALWDAKEKQASYQAAVAANQLAESNLTTAQSIYNESVINLSSISAAVSAQQAVLQQEQSELNALQNQPANSYETSSPGWTNSVEASTASSTSVILPPMYDASTKINVPFDIKMGNTLYEGQGSDSQIYVTSKAFISFGQGDHTFWDWPQTTGIYVYQSDWMTAGQGAYTKITTTDNTLTVEWSLHRFGDSNGPLTNVIWNMIVDPSSGEWTGYSEISGNTEGLYGGPRIGVRYSNGGTIQTMSPKIVDSVSAEIVAQQQEVVNSESAVLVNLQTEQALQTIVVEDASESLAIAQSTSLQADVAEIQALSEFTTALQNTQNVLSNLIVIVENAETKVQTAYVVTTDAIANLPAPTPAPEPVITPEPQPTVDPSPEPTPTIPPVEPEPTPEPSEEPSPEPTPDPEPSPTEPEPAPTEDPTPEPSPEPTPTIEPTPLPEPEPIVPEEPTEPEPVDPESPEEPAVEIETEISSENIVELMEELSEIVPTELTKAQAEAIKEAALEVFETAEPGSDAYEAALDALMVAAQQDDIVISEELAAIPLIGDVAGAAIEVLNALGNAGADMSPQVRETSEEVVVAAVIVGQVAMTATSAATASAAMASRRP